MICGPSGGPGWHNALRDGALGSGPVAFFLPASRVVAASLTTSPEERFRELRPVRIARQMLWTIWFRTLSFPKSCISKRHDIPALARCHRSHDINATLKLNPLAPLLSFPRTRPPPTHPPSTPSAAIGTVRRLSSNNLPGTRATKSAFRIYQTFGALLSVDISGTGVTDDGLQLLLGAGKVLSSLGLRDLPGLTDRGLAAVLQYIKNRRKLRDLQLCRSLRFTDSGKREEERSSEEVHVIFCMCKGSGSKCNEKVEQQRPGNNLLH